MADLKNWQAVFPEADEQMLRQAVEDYAYLPPLFCVGMVRARIERMKREKAAK